MIEDFTATYELYQKAIFRYCLQKCRDREIGLDLTQETFLRYLLCLQRNEEILHARGFLYRIAYNLFVDHVRRKKEASLDALLETGFEPAVDLWHQTQSRLDAEKPLLELARMRDPFKKVLHCRFVLGLPVTEIAAMTGETSNTVSVRICRGLKQLRVVLEPSRMPAVKRRKRSDVMIPVLRLAAPFPSNP